ncbi:MAG: transglutaminase family protein [Candidatus Marinimicrobia bacterium]|nr:transglutaminase family protein [Candidatus Neomarinimicrobiota bacterium]
MLRLAINGANDPRVISFTERLTNTGDPVSRIFEFVKTKIKYERDPKGTEQLSSPWVTIQKGYEDCDGKVVLAMAMLKVIGIESRFMVQAVKNDRFNHVLLQFYEDEQWINFDPTYNKNIHVIGWRYPEADREQIFSKVA